MNEAIKLAEERYPIQMVPECRTTDGITKVTEFDINSLHRNIWLEGFKAGEGKWVAVDKTNLPEGNILAYNGEDFMIGYLYLFKRQVNCDADVYCLENVTHYQILTPPKTEI